ncbi:MAG: hypothetical protein HYW63_00005 [Candidatus Levybacteria bacterium]|nr:hypothetical protein [Candidatus Levybacteria bacterium]
MLNTTNKKILQDLLKYWYLLVVLVFIGSILAQSASAQIMSNGSYKLQMGNLNSIAGESSGSNYNLSITSGETAPGLYSGTNYNVKAGFQYVPRGGPFSFSISNTLIDFGVLSPTNPVTRRSTLTISNSSAPSYQVTASENHQLQVVRSGAIIPDTTCDRGNCSESQAGQWSNTLTYGFGYRCDAISIISKSARSASCNESDKSFITSDYFKQF